VVSCIAVSVSSSLLIIATTEIGLFAECLKQSAKPGKHSAKSLTSVTLDKESSANSTSATASLSSTFYWALDKDFVECHSVLGKEKPLSRRLVTKTVLLLSVLGDTRQRDYICRVSSNTLGKEITSLSSVSQPTLGKGATSGAFCQFLCRCRVPGSQHSAKKLYRCPGVPSRPSAMTLTLGKVTSIHLFHLFFLFYPNKQKISHIHHRYHIIIFVKCPRMANFCFFYSIQTKVWLGKEKIKKKILCRVSKNNTRHSECQT
jgi:hypothetical protein